MVSDQQDDNQKPADQASANQEPGGNDRPRNNTPRRRGGRPWRNSNQNQNRRPPENRGETPASGPAENPPAQENRQAGTWQGNNRRPDRRRQGNRRPDNRPRQANKLAGDAQPDTPSSQAGSQPAGDNEANAPRPDRRNFRGNQSGRDRGQPRQGTFRKDHIIPSVGQQPDPGTPDEARPNNRDQQGRRRGLRPAVPNIGIKDYPGSETPPEELPRDIDYDPTGRKDTAPNVVQRRYDSVDQPSREPDQKASEARSRPNQRGRGARGERGPRNNLGPRNDRNRAPRQPRGERQAEEKQRSYSSYTSLVDRYPANRQAPSVPIATDRGIKLRSQRGSLSKNWWSRRWIDAMERLVDPHRLQRGRSYARSGQVLSFNENRAGIEALVQGSRPAPYKVTIQVTHLSNDQWSQVVDAMAEQALFTAQLLAGEMPADIESAFESAGVSLFPSRGGDLNSHCSCPDWANPCKHVAATHYILGDRFDDDPFLLFRMRGRTQDQILDELRQRRGGAYQEEESDQPGLPSAPPLEELASVYWQSSEDLDSFPLTISPPSLDMPMFKRLGEPAFLPGDSLQSILKPVYDSFTRSALRAAYTEEEPLENGSQDL